MIGIKRSLMTLGFLFACTFGLQATAAPIVRDITGFIVSTDGSGANVGAGAVIGSIAYDNASPVFDFGSSAIFAADLFSLVFSNGPTLSEADTSLEVEVAADSGDLLSILVGFGFFGPLNGFGGLSDLTLNTDGFTSDLFFSDANFSVVAEGSIAFAPDRSHDVPVTSTLALLLLGALAFLRRSPRSFRILR